MACSKKITANIIFDCADSPLKGLDGGEAIILNYEDIDKGASTQTGAILDTITMLGATTGQLVQWYRELASVATALTRNAEDFDGFSHSFLARLATTSAANAERANELKNGRFVVVVKTSYKGGTAGDEADKYKVFGWDAGLELSELAGNSNENSSSLLFTLATREGTYEKYPYNILFAGGVAEPTESDAVYDALKPA